ncbi:MAG: hypothetical protein KF832_02120 [Caldilineaceae bacterium]|nr:hypothetical protein [Caldilineaceae bacterium]
MTQLQLTQVPSTKTGMLIRKPPPAVYEAIQGFSLMLAGLKAFLEHQLRLNLVADRYPAGLTEG